MQAGFILALFGSLFFVIASMTSTMVESTQQMILRQNAETQQLFNDVERTINDVVLKQNASIDRHSVALDSGKLTEIFGSTNTALPWRPEQLEKDPWGREFDVTVIPRGYVAGSPSESEPPVAAFGPQRHATPVVHYFTLASPGRDRIYQTQLSGGATKSLKPADYWQWVDLRAEGAKGDDIIHTFSTRDAAIAIWNRMDDVHTRMSRQLRSDYIRAVDDFLKREDVKDRFDNFYSCVARGLTSCLPFTTAAVQNCIAANTSGEINWPQPAQSLPEGWPHTLGTYPSWWPKMTTANCWMAEPVFRNMEGFPSMVLQAVRASGEPGFCNQDCSISAAQLENLGLGPLRGRDPLGGSGIEFLYTRQLPTLILMRRELNEDGWHINMDLIVDGERTGT